jgi:L-2-hydroxyglutarate oxidase
MAASEQFECRTLVACAGLESDRVVRRDGAVPIARVVPFRGEYYELSDKTRHYVNGIVYPVPDPRFPFLGVHLTRSIDGAVHAGPNAVLAFSREGYSWMRIDLVDMFSIASWPGFWRLASRYWREGADEMARSLSKARFVRSLQKLVPRIGIDDLHPAQSGVRAQSITREGEIVDDFLIVRNEGALHVCNAPSPAATASLEIAKEIVAML